MRTTAHKAWTTTDDIPDLGGIVAVVTGANSGLGLVTTRELARKGATVVMACRSAERGEAARARVAGSLPPNLSDVSVLPLDLANLASVRDFADAVGERFDGLDLLINNAGVMALPQRRTADGFEMQMGTNHLGHFALSGLLAPLLLSRPGARVVTVASGAHFFGRPDPAYVRGWRVPYRKWRAYGASKSANLMFTAELARRAQESGVDLVSVAAHPGYADTNLQGVGPRMTGNSRAERGVALANRLLATSPDTGALPQLYAATAPRVENGAFYGPRFGMLGRPARTPRAPWVRDVALARRLWEASEEVTGVRWAPPLAD